MDEYCERPELAKPAMSLFLAIDQAKPLTVTHFERLGAVDPDPLLGRLATSASDRKAKRSVAVVVTHDYQPEPKQGLGTGLEPHRMGMRTFKRTTGLEPATFGLGSRADENDARRRTTTTACR